MKRKVPSSTTFDAVQKDAMRVIYIKIGIPMTKQVEDGLNLYFQNHTRLLKENGFEFDHGELTKVTRK